MALSVSDLAQDFLETRGRAKVSERGPMCQIGGSENSAIPSLQEKSVAPHLQPWVFALWTDVAHQTRRRARAAAPRGSRQSSPPSDVGRLPEDRRLVGCWPAACALEGCRASPSARRQDDRQTLAIESHAPFTPTAARRPRRHLIYESARRLPPPQGAGFTTCCSPRDQPGPRQSAVQLSSNPCGGTAGHTGRPELPSQETSWSGNQNPSAGRDVPARRGEVDRFMIKMKVTYPTAPRRADTRPDCGRPRDPASPVCEGRSPLASAVSTRSTSQQDPRYSGPRHAHLDP